MVGSPRRQLALDANLLLDLAEGRDFAHEFKEEFLRRGYALLAPPTVLAELAVLAAVGAEPQRSLANSALEQLAGWNCRPFTLSSTELAIAQHFSLRLLAKGLIPEEERNDGKILAQTSLAQIPLLVTSDKHLLDIDEGALLLAFQEADLLVVHPVHPKRLLRALR
jgi:hypothetical protein